MQDVRGRYRPEGGFVPFVKEHEDGYDAVEWAARLPGSNGSVGMYASGKVVRRHLNRRDDRNADRTFTSSRQSA